MGKFRGAWTAPPGGTPFRRERLFFFVRRYSSQLVNEATGSRGVWNVFTSADSSA